MHALRGWAFAVLCILLGILAGRLMPGEPPAPLWRETPIAAPTQVAPPGSFAEIVAAAQPGIVSVRVRLPDQVDEAGTGAAGADHMRWSTELLEHDSGYRNGSGFVVHASGLVVTSRHVVAAAVSIEVLVANQRPMQAVVFGEDIAADLALLRLEDPPADLHALPLGCSEDVRAGDWIVAFGNPCGFDQTVTAGIVSFVGRHLPHSDLAVTSDFLQISAAVNPGSSGGPVLAMDGRVVGVTTKAAVEAQGISFAVPSKTLKWALAAMERSRDGRVRRGYLGIEFATRAAGDGSSCGGAVILRVLEGAPAAAAGIRRGDVILAVDGVPIADAGMLHERIVNGAPGSQLAMQVLRSGSVRDSIEAVLSEMAGSTAEVPWN
ncbi:MAG: trypsin-like peptidase domain-containing protein [Planctomycetes bacterium]|nr:trypsin-like peptidase domain-containing protein [Planctomycetota bacterium]